MKKGAKSENALNENALSGALNSINKVLVDWLRGGGAVRSGVERHSFGVRTHLWGGGVRHQWLRSVSSNEIGKKFFTQQKQATGATAHAFYEL